MRVNCAPGLSQTILENRVRSILRTLPIQEINSSQGFESIASKNAANGRHPVQHSHFLVNIACSQFKSFLSRLPRWNKVSINDMLRDAFIQLHFQPPFQRIAALSGTMN